MSHDEVVEVPLDSDWEHEIPIEVKDAATGRWEAPSPALTGVVAFFAEEQDGASLGTTTAIAARATTTKLYFGILDQADLESDVGDLRTGWEVFEKPGDFRIARRVVFVPTRTVPA